MPLTKVLITVKTYPTLSAKYCLARHGGNEEKALLDVRTKYFNDFAKTKDLHFFLGTTQAHHHVSHNPFIIIGTFHPKIETQAKLF
jgi:hypothetical protein